MRLEDCKDDIVRVVISEEQIKERIAQMGAEISKDYAGEPLLVVGVLRGAVMVVADVVREISIPLHIDWMAVSSYGASTKSSGVVRILKDLNTDITGINVLIVEDIIDTGLTLDYLKQNLEARGPKSVKIATFLRKPDASEVDVPVDYIGFDIPNEFVVGYGLDYAEDYRHLTFIGTLSPHVYGG